MSALLNHPSFPFALAAILALFVGPAGRRVLSILAPISALAIVAGLPLGAEYGFDALGRTWVLLRFDELSRIFAIAFILYAIVAGIYAWTETDRGPKAASLGLAGAGIGVVLAGDLLSLFFFWEWLTVTSLFLIWFGRTAGAWGAGFRYLMFHLAGATVMLIGILLQMAEGVDAFVAFSTASGSAWLILIGMLTNAAVPPLHAWLSDAYPRASIYGTVFLAAFTTKSAVYAMIRGFPGVDALVYLGVAMALFGVVYAVLENDTRRLLAYHIISQVGYMVTGIGLGTALALNGTAAHAFAHIFYKGLLMMAAGAVIHATGRGKLTDLGALATPLKWTLVLMMIGAFSISGVPFFNGFVSKSMVVSAAAYSERGGIELLLLLASMGTFLHTGLKLPWFTFFGRDHGARVQRPVPASMYLAMGLTAAVCIVTGIVPGATIYALLPFDASYNPFTAHHFVESMQILTGAALGFWILRVKLYSEPTTTRDIDFIYRQPLLQLVGGAGAAIEVAGERTQAAFSASVDAVWRRIRYIGELGRSAPVALQTSIVFVGIAIATGLAFLIAGN